MWWRRIGHGVLSGVIVGAAAGAGCLPDPSGLAVDAAPPRADAAAVEPDRGRPDGAPPDMRAAAPDARVVDAAGPDLALPDAAGPDLALPDAAGPDLALPDAAGPDLAAPDAAPPDLALPPGNPLLPAAPNRTCALPEAPPIGRYVTERAFPALRFERPLWIGAAPGDPDTLYVVEQGGTIWAFDDRDDVAAREPFLALDVLRSNNEEGLLGLAFHPEYAANGRFFVNYSARGAACPGGASRCSIVAEFARAAPRAADPASGVPLLTVVQPFGNHNGGDLRFGPDGLLYISLGDGGSGGDPQGHGQNTDTLLGSILRIDVDRAGDAACPDCAYGIPPDNPFADGADGRPEIWAWGLRNVWRMAFDRATGALWAADVGQNAVEEIDRITAPGNFGWNIKEGDDCYGPLVDCDDADLVPPIWTYRHALGRSVTGGLVYRGPRLPELWGAYVFGDYVSGRLWALRARPGEPPAVEEIGAQPSVTHFGEDAGGRLYLTSFAADRPIARLVRAEAPDGPPFPRRLSETGCFADTAAHVLAPGVVPYQLNRPFWSDGADKLRAVALPEGAVVAPDLDDPDGAYRFPVGAVLIKTFVVPEVDADGAPAPRRISTRLYTRQADGWRGFVYRWNAEQTDAELLDDPARTPYLAADGERSWIHPARVECDVCHTAAAGHALGWRTRQLAGEFTLDGVRYDQLDALVEVGLLAEAPAERPAFPRPAAAPPADPAALEAEARARLDVDCSTCHRPGGGANAALDLRFATPLADTGLCEAPGQGDLGLPDARIVAPGDHRRSVLWHRMARRDGEAMPPIGSARPDAAALELLAAWIDAGACAPR